MKIELTKEELGLLIGWAKYIIEQSEFDEDEIRLYERLNSISE